MNTADIPTPPPQAMQAAPAPRVTNALDHVAERLRAARRGLFDLGLGANGLEASTGWTAKGWTIAGYGAVGWAGDRTGGLRITAAW